MKPKYKMLLQNLLEPLIDPNDNYKSIKDSTDRLYELFEAISGVNNFEEIYIKDMKTDHGRAIGTYWAGKCIHEFMRTKKFIHGVYLGILEAKQKFPDTRIHILYSGTRPFGSLLLDVRIKMIFKIFHQGSTSYLRHHFYLLKAYIGHLFVK